MKISLNWLQEYLPGALDRQTAAEALTHGGLPVENFEERGDDTVIDVEVTSNRSDCLSHIGVARELAALLNRDFCDVPPAPSPAEGGFVASAPSVSVSIEATDLCPHYTARIIQNIKIGPSPAWMTRRLEAVGVRPINNVVDVTNYVLFEMGQPLHAFDFDKIEGGGIIVRREEGRKTHHHRRPRARTKSGDARDRRCGSPRSAGRRHGRPRQRSQRPNSQHPIGIRSI